MSRCAGPARSLTIEITVDLWTWPGGEPARTGRPLAFVMEVACASALGDVSLWFDVSGPSVIPREDTTVERPVLVAVHGGPGLDHLTVKSALGPLAEDFQVLYFDLRGHGRSDHSSAEFWNMRTWADDLRRLPRAPHHLP